MWQVDGVTEAEQSLLLYIAATPRLVSLLYDLDWLPEQLTEGSRARKMMLAIAEAWRDDRMHRAVPAANILALVRAFPLGHTAHWDEEGNAGQTCPLCIAQREAMRELEQTLVGIASPTPSSREICA